MTTGNSWYEVWADETHEVPYLLILRPRATAFEVLDPRDGNRCSYASATYEEARLWLLEDEFECVGRKLVE